jgi:membrane protease YdiL (CAAX protease family)
MTWSSRRLAGFGSAWPAIAVLVLLAIAALVPPVRPFLLMALLVAYGLARWRTDRTGRIATVLAAALPASAILAWGAFPQPIAATGDCTDLLAPPAVWRLIEAGIGVVLVAVLVVDRRSGWAELGLRIGSRRNLAFALVAFALAVPLTIYVGGLLGQPGIGGSFFGAYQLDLGQPLALAPAAVFAISNALAEELAYRGALRVWLAPSLGFVGANLGQAIVFGLAHSGQDFVGPFVPTAVAMVAAGFVAGVIARRTSSIAIVLAVHVAADIPLFLYWACRVG